MTQVPKLFADATMALEDMCMIAVHGQRRGTSPDRRSPELTKVHPANL
jgi:hypothetical protein